uniref:SDR family NAD(P)-dependent oxidoreductase n=1 Tax=Arthrobacter sp. TaxID=1667 RepID=UPI002588BEDB
MSADRQRTALVTGGASGIGAAVATALADAGLHVVVADLDGDAAEEVAARIGGEAWAVDLLDTAPLETLELDCDVLVNNAGFQKVAPITEFDPDTFRRIQRLMVEAPFLLIRAALPGMCRRGWGRIIN